MTVSCSNMVRRIFSCHIVRRHLYRVAKVANYSEAGSKAIRLPGTVTGPDRNVPGNITSLLFSQLEVYFLLRAQKTLFIFGSSIC